MSAKYGDRTNRLIEISALPDEDDFLADRADQTDEFLPASLSGVVLQTGQKFRGVTVLVESFEEVEDNRGRSVSIDAVILCNKRYKQILVGRRFKD